MDYFHFTSQENDFRIGTLFDSDDDKPSEDDIYNSTSKIPVTQRNPIIFTTKLDDMVVFNEYTQYSMSKAKNETERESKPTCKLNTNGTQYCRKTSHLEKKTISERMTSFKILKHKIYLINLNSMTKRRIVKNVSVKNYGSKEVSITFNRNRQIVRNTVPKSLTASGLTTKKNSDVNVDDPKTVSDTFNSNKQIAITSVPKSDIASAVTINFKKVFLSFFDKQLNEWHIYFICKDRTIHQYTKMSKQELTTNNPLISNIFSLFNNDQKSITFEYCCWSKREQYINRINANKPSFGNIVISAFLKTKHPCPYDKCSCCCKVNSENVPQNSASVSIDSELFSSSRVPINSVNNNYQDNILSKALNYVPNAKTRRGNDITNKTDESNVQHSKVVLIVGKDDTSNKHYLFGPTGNVVAYLTGHKKRLTAMNKSTCCWCDREDFLGQLKSQNNLMADELKYLRCLHDCPVGNCTCCCKSFSQPPNSDPKFPPLNLKEINTVHNVNPNNNFLLKIAFKHNELFLFDNVVPNTQLSPVMLDLPSLAAQPGQDCPPAYAPVEPTAQINPPAQPSPPVQRAAVRKLPTNSCLDSRIASPKLSAVKLPPLPKIISNCSIPAGIANQV